MKWGIRVGEVPRALWAWVVLSAASALVYAVIGLFEVRLLFLIGVPLTIVFAWLLLRGSRVVWTFWVAGGVLTLATAPFEGTSWWNLVIETAGTALLLFPSVRRFIWSGRGRKISKSAPAEWSGKAEGSVDPGPQTSWNPRHHSDAERPQGWYVHPEFPGQMQYWAGEDAGWLGTTKTPRKIRAEVDEQAKRN